jgi:hypothetical protein
LWGEEAAHEGKLYAIATGTNGPANSTWPMFQQNWEIEEFLGIPSMAKQSSNLTAPTVFLGVFKGSWFFLTLSWDGKE